MSKLPLPVHMSKLLWWLERILHLYPLCVNDSCSSLPALFPLAVLLQQFGQEEGRPQRWHVNTAGVCCLALGP